MIKLHTSLIIPIAVKFVKAMWFFKSLCLFFTICTHNSECLFEEASSMGQNYASAPIMLKIQTYGYVPIQFYWFCQRCRVDRTVASTEPSRKVDLMIFTCLDGTNFVVTKILKTKQIKNFWQHFDYRFIFLF